MGQAITKSARGQTSCGRGDVQTAFAPARCILGTAQLGQAYGIANTTGMPDQATANAIVRTALENGIVRFDTAIGYGDSEAVLGKALAAEADARVGIITKLPPALPECPTAWKVCLAASLRALGVHGLYCLMLHREEHLPLLDGPLGRFFQTCREKRIIERAGISVYTPGAALAALDHPCVDVVQIPAGLFDRRFEDAGVFTRSRERGKEVHIRSVLLQGVLCMAPEALPARLAPLAPALGRLHAVSRDLGCTPASLAIAWALRRYPDADILFGAERPEQVRGNLAFTHQAGDAPAALWDELDALVPPQRDDLLNPALWQG